MSEPETPRTDAAKKAYDLRLARQYQADRRGSHLDADDPQVPDGWETAATLEAEAGALRALHAAIVSVAEEAYAHWDQDRDSKVGKLLLAIIGERPGIRPDLDAARAKALAGKGAGE